MSQSRGKNTDEYRTVRKNFPVISNAIASREDIDSICEELLAEGLITDNQKAEACNDKNPIKNRASAITDILLRKVEQDTQNFRKLIKVLQRLDKDVFGPVLTQMGIVGTDASQSTNGASMSSTNSTTLDSTNSGNSHYPCTVANLEEELNAISEPYRLGVHLKIETKDLDGMERNHSGDVARLRTAVIKFWYDNTDESERTWGRVADAVKALRGHRNLENRLRKLGDDREPPPEPKRPKRQGDDREPPPEPKRQGGALKFSNDLSPADLVDWLSQELTARSLTLEKDVKSELKEQQINGEAFKDLTKDDLNEMGFKMGPRKIILKIIEDLKQTDVEA